jgi:4-hydroxy 2-oxovalerate aldolase
MKILDCTLRDGGNLNDWQFPWQTIECVVNELSASGIDYIEVGYFGGVGKLSNNPGLTACCNQDFFEKLPQCRTKLSVLIIPDYQPDLEELILLPVNLIRIAVYPWEFEKALPIAEFLAGRGMHISINCMASSYITPDSISQLAEYSQSVGVSIFYIVDSFGSLLPKQVKEYVEAAKCYCQIGFHGHDNLGLGVANCLAALDAGAEFVDTALCGMARGAGNAQTEKLAGIMMTQSKPYDAIRIAKLADTIISPLLPVRTDGRLVDISCGVHDVNSQLLQSIRQVSQKFDIPVEQIIAAIGKEKPREHSYALVEKIALGIP